MTNYSLWEIFEKRGANGMDSSSQPQSILKKAVSKKA